MVFYGISWWKMFWKRYDRKYLVRSIFWREGAQKHFNNLTSTTNGLPQQQMGKPPSDKVFCISTIKNGALSPFSIEDVLIVSFWFVQFFSTWRSTKARDTWQRLGQPPTNEVLCTLALNGKDNAVSLFSSEDGLEGIWSKLFGFGTFLRRDGPQFEVSKHIYLNNDTWDLQQMRCFAFLQLTARMMIYGISRSKMYWKRYDRKYLVWSIFDETVHRST